MSSNAFARSRTRNRRERTPRAHYHQHPRFLQLTKELARIDAAKKKLEDIESEVASSSGRICSSTANSSTPSEHQASSTISDCCTNAQNLANSTLGGCGGSEAQSSNGYRSLECNQASHTLNDNHHRQSNNNNHHHHNHHHHHYHHNRTVNHNYPHQRVTIHLSNSNLHQSPQLRPQDDCCPGKCSSHNPATAAVSNLGYSKLGLAEQNNSDFSNINLDLRQNENRSKRKRSLNDSCPGSKKTALPSSSTSTSCGGEISKPRLSSPEPTKQRPLSPSFTKCPICLLDCMDRDPSFTNTCFHLFCFVCIESWTKNKATCPLCRTKFTKIIYNIRSESCYDEKIVSPIRRDDDDDPRITYEQLQGLSTNQMVPGVRGASVEDPRIMFDTYRNANDVLMAPLPFLSYHNVPRHQDSLRSFNSSTSTANFNTNVPHSPYTNYNPTSSNYLLIGPSVGLTPRLQQIANSHDALPSAYATANSGIANNNSDPIRGSRLSRGRNVYPRGYDSQAIDNSSRVSRATSTSLSSTGIPLERQQQQPQQQQQQPQQQTQHHHHQQPHQHTSSHHQHLGSNGQHNQPRSTTFDLVTRQNHSHIPLLNSLSGYYNPSAYSRRPYTNPPIEQHSIDNSFRQLPDL